MKTAKLLSLLFVACFVLGAGLTAVTPDKAQAGPNQCDYDCYVVYCETQGSCSPPYVERVAYYGWLIDECFMTTYNCYSRVVGCGIPC